MAPPTPALPAPHAPTVKGATSIPAWPRGLGPAPPDRTAAHSRARVTGPPAPHPPVRKSKMAMSMMLRRRLLLPCGYNCFTVLQ